ncbi:hypothetical protein FDP41_006154 [Naegleria fowleri]|uniref:DNA-directed RNA polymerase III subunit RPC4 n=1 Tax=Naegleria fowleri TaxID=5763 RepID=A0A6A5BL04_NAEFO|nr:uncharacterized protein FDP41_006154 [Naegleria fowleri]KAF0974680.1 hypothetical protein FDP41_006154 [Naegleria fowleri]CAG4718500.1 unnamed protein product [Naegleria fowleri]
MPFHDDEDDDVMDISSSSRSQSSSSQQKKTVVYDASRLLAKPSVTASSSGGASSASGSNTLSSQPPRLQSILPPRNIDKPTQHYKTSSTSMNFTPNFKPKPIKTEDSSKDDINLDVFMGQAANQTGKRKPTYNKPSTKAIMNKATTFNLVTGITPSASFSSGFGGMDIGGFDAVHTSTSGMNLTASGFETPKEGEDDDAMMERELNRRKNLFKGIKQPPTVLPFNEEAFLRAEAQRAQSVERYAIEDSIDELQQSLFRSNGEALMSEDQLFFIQLPSKIPYMDAAERKRQQAQEKKAVSTSVDDAENIWTQPFENTLAKVPSGLVGEMVIYKSGKVKLKLGDVLLDVFPGSEFSFPEHVACIDIADKDKQGNCHILGNIAKRFSCVPDVDYLLSREETTKP